MGDLQTDVVRRVESILKGLDAYGATFFEIGEHTPIAGIRKGIQVFKDNGCDFIVSVGGGSPVDGSKAMLYNIQLETGGPTLKQVAIPTTLSAAEYSVRVPSPDNSCSNQSDMFRWSDWSRVYDRRGREDSSVFAGPGSCRHHLGCRVDTPNARASLVRRKKCKATTKLTCSSRLSTGIRALDHAVGELI